MIRVNYSSIGSVSHFQLKAKKVYKSKENIVEEGKEKFYFTFCTTDKLYKDCYHIEIADNKETAIKQFKDNNKFKWHKIGAIYDNSSWIIKKGECSFWDDICDNPNIIEVTQKEAYKLTEV